MEGGLQVCAMCMDIPYLSMIVFMIEWCEGMYVEDLGCNILLLCALHKATLWLTCILFLIYDLSP